MILERSTNITTPISWDWLTSPSFFAISLTKLGFPEVVLIDCMETVAEILAGRQCHSRKFDSCDESRLSPQ